MIFKNMNWKRIKIELPENLEGRVIMDLNKPPFFNRKNRYGTTNKEQKNKTNKSKS